MTFYFLSTGSTGFWESKNNLFNNFVGRALKIILNVASQSPISFKMLPRIYIKTMMLNTHKPEHTHAHNCYMIYEGKIRKAPGRKVC